MDRILYIIDSYKDPYAGTEGQLYRLIQGLDRKRFKPKLILFRPSDYVTREGFPCEVEVLNIQKLSHPHAWMRLWSLAKHARAEGYRLAHIFFNDASIAAPFFLKVHGVKVLISRRDMGFWYNRWNLRLLRLNRVFIDGVVANSEAVKSVTHTREQLSLKKIHVIANGYPPVNSNTAIQCPPVIADFAEHGDCIVGMVANIRAIKRIQDAIEAVAMLRRQGCPISLIVVGDGDASPLEELARKRAVRAHVCFLGARHDAESLMRFFSIGLLCSESEGFSNTIIEYLRAGLPVVCTDAGGNPEVIHDDKNGYLYPVGDTARLAQLLQTMVQDAKLRRRLGEGALASACNYTLDSMLERHAELYSRLLSCSKLHDTQNASFDNADRKHYPAENGR